MHTAALAMELASGEEKKRQAVEQPRFALMCCRLSRSLGKMKWIVGGWGQGGQQAGIGKTGPRERIAVADDVWLDSGLHSLCGSGGPAL